MDKFILRLWETFGGLVQKIGMWIARKLAQGGIEALRKLVSRSIVRIKKRMKRLVRRGRSTLRHQRRIELRYNLLGWLRSEGDKLKQHVSDKLYHLAIDRLVAN